MCRIGPRSTSFVEWADYVNNIKTQLSWSTVTSWKRLTKYFGLLTWSIYLTQLSHFPLPPPPPQQIKTLKFGCLLMLLQFYHFDLCSDLDTGLARPVLVYSQIIPCVKDQSQFYNTALRHTCKFVLRSKNLYRIGQLAYPK